MHLSLIDNKILNELTCPPGRPHVEVFDRALKGFYVDVLASGRKSFRLRYRFNKKLRVVTLGDAALMSLEDARQAALEWLRQVKTGTDPLAPPVQVLGPTVSDFFTDQYLPYIKSYKRSWDTDDSMMRNHLLPKLGHKHMGAITPPDVAVFVEQMKSEGYAPGTCNRALVLLRYGFTLAVRWKLPGVQGNPVKEVKNLRDDNKIERFLSNEQMVSLMSAVRGSESEMLQHIVLFLLYTGARKREVLDATWADVDWERKSWRIPKTKSGKIRHIPLSVGALQLLAALRGPSMPPAEWGHVERAEWMRRPIFAVCVVFLQLGRGPQTGGFARSAGARLAPQFCLLFGQCRAQPVRGAGVAGPCRHPHHQPLCPPEPGAVVRSGGVGAGAVGRRGGLA